MFDHLESEIVTIDSEVFDRQFIENLFLPAVQVRERKANTFFLTDLMGDGRRHVWLFNYTFALGQVLLSPELDLLNILLSFNEK